MGGSFASGAAGGRRLISTYGQAVLNWMGLARMLEAASVSVAAGLAT
jgi:hypothetical protein